MKKILLLGSQHGNERLGDKLYTYLRRRHPALLPHVTYKIGNPKAHKQRVRYIESDLNRSYNGQTITYEERRAAHILAAINEVGYDLVLDLHTTTCTQPPCFIVADIKQLACYLRASTIPIVIEMKHLMVRSSLIGVCPQAISIEVNRDEVDTILETICQDMLRYIHSETTSRPKEIFTVTELLGKSEIPEEEANALQNFQKSKFGFYPVLTGENSYKRQTNYLGFKASHRRVSKV